MSWSWADTGNPAPVSQPIPVAAFPLPITDYDGTVSSFRASYQKMGSPRILIYVNRSLIAERGEMLETTRSEQSVKTKGDAVLPEPSQAAVQVGSGNQATQEAGIPPLPKTSGKGGERLVSESHSQRVNAASDLGTGQTTQYDARQIEETFQKPFFDAEAKLVDQKIAELALKKLPNADSNFLTAPQTDKEREQIEALRQSADIAVEILIRSKSVTIPQVSGKDKVETRLEVVATVTQLKDGVKLAQINSDTLFGFNRRDGKAKEARAARVTSAEIVEQTALAVMQRLK
ncbi:MAG: hypothetical protein V1746_06960 [bacterium]